MGNMESEFVWDEHKEAINIQKHGVNFTVASKAFMDVHRRILIDEKHNTHEDRLFCIGKVEGRVLMVRFVYRNDHIRILGAGYWRKGERIYEKKSL